MAHTEAEMEALTDEQLIQLANEEALNPPALPEQPRDEKGQFVAEQPAEVPPEPEPEAQKSFVARAEIDLKDGSGVQVFTGVGETELAAERDLNRQLVKAQENATRKIRDDNKRLKEAAPAEVPPLTPDEEYLLAQELMTTPSKALETVISRHVGMSLKEFRDASATIRRQAVQSANVETFQAWMGSHPEFVDVHANGEKMGRYLSVFHGGIATPEALDAAYNRLREDGLLITEKPAAPPATPPPAASARRSSGITSRGSVQVPAKGEPTEQEMYEMPIEKLRRLGGGGSSNTNW